MWKTKTILEFLKHIINLFLNSAKKVNIFITRFFVDF